MNLIILYYTVFTGILRHIQTQWLVTSGRKDNWRGLQVELWLRRGSPHWLSTGFMNRILCALYEGLNAALAQEPPDFLVGCRSGT